MKTIFEYRSYRQFLKDFYEYRNREGHYTYRDFSKAAGMNSSSWLLHLIKGSKNLSASSAARAARALRLSDVESRYFFLLVRFTQAKSGDEKDRLFREMLEFKDSMNEEVIERGEYEYYTAWYHPVIRSLVDKVEWNDDYSLLGRLVVPAISAHQARESVKLLVRLGFISQDDNGRWHRSAAVCTTGDELEALNVVNYHKEVAQLARDAYDRCTREEREISALTVGIGEREFARIKSRIQAFRKEIIEIVRNGENPDRVYQLNFQFFPASRPKRMYKKRKS